MFKFREVEKNFDTEKEVTRTYVPNIKPETDITVAEARDFIVSLFQN